MKRKRRRNWIKLDNAAKIFPPSTNKMDSKVFRFACELREEIQEEVLQQALDKTLSIFKGYQVVLKHGLFWYYLEDTELMPKVHEEHTPICQQLYDKNESALLFDVFYYRNRISFEIYHALADGRGAMLFLRELVCQYLMLTHADELGENPPDSEYEGSHSERMADSFDKYYVPQKIKRTKSPITHQLKRGRLSENRLKVIEGIADTGKALALAKQHDATLTAFLVSLLICSIADNMTVRERKKPIGISIPVNLRSYFPSESSRNFFSVVNVFYRFKGEEVNFEDVLTSIKKQMAEKLCSDCIREKMNNMIAIEKNPAIRIIPLTLKNFFMNLGYKIADRSVTASLSNIGKVTMPEVYQKHIRLFDVMASTKKIQICLCSYGNNLVMSFTDGFVSADIQKCFFRKLTAMNLPIEIVSSPLEEGN
ncbi:hypothetical protein [Scatolibacter rhodanostii]|uniref:hypothetical protein n=1 Tax=Scatolibacter rhodanostii TaxID=2014781 RepID=UPI000C074994|nr:hypothetical protein [Scatolibacter rhodanostii]